MGIHRIREKMKLIISLLATVFAVNVMEGGRCYHYHGDYKHEVAKVKCRRGPVGGQTCDSIPHADTNGCPLELEDYECDGSICKLDAPIGGTTWDGHRNCECQSRIISDDDIDYYAEDGPTVVGVSGTATDLEFSSKYEFCTKQCRHHISQDSTFS